MSVENVSSETNAARAIAQKRRELEDETNALEVQRNRVRQDQNRSTALAKEKADKEIVQISKAGEQQVEMVKKMNTELVRSVNTNTQKNYEALAAKTAEEIRRLDADALKTIQDHRLGTMEKVKSVTDQTEDPFYRLKSLNPMMSESDSEYTVKVALPPHEAQNLFVSSEGQALKLSLARRFQEQAKDPTDARLTKTSSYQTVVETLNLPGPVDAKGIKREIADGVVTIRLPKMGGLPPGFGEPA